jgi:hypothetical protein
MMHVREPGYKIAHKPSAASIESNENSKFSILTKVMPVFLVFAVGLIRKYL